MIDIKLKLQEDLLTVNADPAQIDKFPLIETIVKKDYSSYVKMNKKLLAKRLMSVATAKNANALFKFADEKLLLHVISESGYKPSSATVPINKVDDELKAVFSIAHLLDIIKAITSDTIDLNVPENKKSLKITTTDTDRIAYYIMTIVTPVYNNV